MAAIPARSKTSRINIILPTLMLEQLRARADREGLSLTELLRYAIGLAEYVDDAREKGARFVVEWPDGRRAEIVPRFTATASRSEEMERVFA